MNIATTLRYMALENPGPWQYRLWGADHYYQLANKYKIGVHAIMSPYNFEEICERCDGLIVPGSPNNIDPKYYGMTLPDVPLVPYDEYALDEKLIRYFIEHKKPIMGFCGGHQELNVYFGGTIKKLDDQPHHLDQITKTHPITVKEGSFVYDVFGTTRTVVNSYHAWEIGRLADDLNAVAWTDDGVIEAIENKKMKIFATQWHPEISLSKESAVEHKMIENFLKLCEEQR